jgi:CHAT domain-containing protein
LWNVNDRATGLLMVEFYKHLFAQPAGSMDKAAALQAAQVSLMKDPLTRHPFYWAPFGLFGDWR